MAEQDDHDTHYETLSGAAGHKKIAELVKDIHIAMMTAISKDATMNSRPMAAHNVPSDGIVCFLTRSNSGKLDDVGQDDHITLTFADPKNSKYIAIKGNASISNDRAKIKELWNPMYQVWFPGGEDDPQITVIRVDVKEADFWEASDSKLVVLFKYAAAARQIGLSRGMNAVVMAFQNGQRLAGCWPTHSLNADSLSASGREASQNEAAREADRYFPVRPLCHL